MKIWRTCRICGGGDFKKVIDFSKNPLVNSLLDKKDLRKKEEVFPLEIEQCQDCHLVQIVDPIDSHKIYQEQDYLYYTGDMPQNSQYMLAFNSLVDDIINKYSLPEDFIVEIGSNDGTILKNFIGRNKVLGVDPASNVVIRSLAKGVPAISAVFNEHNAEIIAKEFGKAKVIGGANCLAHINDIHEVIRGVSKLLTDDGTFWVECNYWGGMVKNKHYALIYHDHFSYFTLKNWNTLLAQHGMKIFDAFITEAQGEGLSLRLFASKEDRGETERYQKLIKEEIDTNLASYETCKKYEREVREEADKLGNLIKKLKKDGNIIAGYGAAAKGFSVLKLAGIDQKQISYFVDDSSAKQGKYTPVSHIPVISRTEAEKKLPNYFFITAPNYADVIIEKEKEFLKNGGKFITIDSKVIGG